MWTPPRWMATPFLCGALALALPPRASGDAPDTAPGTRPAAPSNLRAAPLSSSRLRLTWQDNSDDETAFVLYLLDLQTAELVEIPFDIPPDVTAVLVSGLRPATAYTFRVRARNAFGPSALSNPASVATFAEDAACTVGETELCLLGGRFRLELGFHDPRTDTVEAAPAVPGTDQTGMFWFFGAENIELIVKMIDGRRLNGHYWVFYGGVSDLEYRLRITDTVSGEAAIYHNPPGVICGLADILAFGDGEAELAAKSSLAAPVDLSGLHVSPEDRPASGTGACEPGAGSLCLLDARLSVEVRWRNPYDGGTEGEGRAMVGSGNTGYFWFFGPENTELVIKALDGGAFNDHLWLFYGALTDLEYWITVTDTATGASRVYYNPPGDICGQADIEAFPAATPPS